MERSEHDYAGKFRSLRRFPAVMERAHWHMHAELVYCASGRVDYALGGSDVRLVADQLVIFWAAVPHRVISSAPDTIVHVINAPAETLWEQSLPEAFVTELLSGRGIVVSATAFREEAFGVWHKELNSGDTLWQQVARNEVGCLIARVAAEFTARAVTRPGKPRPARLGRSQDLLSMLVREIAERADSGLTVAALASSLGYNRRYLTTRFKELTGVTLQAYIRHIRVARARALLISSDDPIETIAWDAGFGSVRQLYDGLRAETGLTPSQVRAGMSPR